jgi:GTP-binding protein
VGTTIIDDETGEVIGDLTGADDELLAAHGGQRGLGNTVFKSSTNRAPRKTTPGEPGEARTLRLQLKLLADVGLLGLPNAGKSTLIGQVSAANPKVADYPFTTLVPNLGVVRIGPDASFVMADIPGLIGGAAQGAGLGARFLRHLTRNQVLLHLVDVLPDDGSDPIENARTVESELAEYSEALLERPIWLVLSKVDQLAAQDLADLRAAFRAAFPKRELYCISALGDVGLDTLVQDLMGFLHQHWRRLADEPEYAAQCERLTTRIGADVSAHAQKMRGLKSSAGVTDSGVPGSDDNEVVYVRE